MPFGVDFTSAEPLFVQPFGSITETNLFMTYKRKLGISLHDTGIQAYKNRYLIVQTHIYDV